MSCAEVHLLFLDCIDVIHQGSRDSQACMCYVCKMGKKRHKTRPDKQTDRKMRQFGGHDESGSRENKIGRRSSNVREEM